MSEWNPIKARRLRDLSVKAYWAAQTPKEAKMASILLVLFAPDVDGADRLGLIERRAA